MYDNGRSVLLGDLKEDASGWKTPTQVVPRASLIGHGPSEAVVDQLFKYRTGQSRLVVLKSERKRELREAYALEMSRAKYAGIRTFVGAAGRFGNDELPTTPFVEISVRRESHGFVIGAAGNILLPASMPAGLQSETEIWTGGVGVDGMFGYAVPWGPALVEPHATLGPGARFQFEGGGTAWALRGAIGATFIAYLPWETDLAIAIESRIGFERLWNLWREGKYGLTDVAWLWTLAFGVDWEAQR